MNSINNKSFKTVDFSDEWLVIKRCGIVLFCFLVLSCKSKYEDCTEDDYANCNTIPFTEGLVEVQLTIDAANPVVRLQLFEGDIVNGELFFDEMIDEDLVMVIKPEGKYYSGRAFYRKGNDSLIAIDGGKIRNLSYQICEYKCNELQNAILDLRIR